MQETELYYTPETGADARELEAKNNPAEITHIINGLTKLQAIFNKCAALCADEIGWVETFPEKTRGIISYEFATLVMAYVSRIEHYVFTLTDYDAMFFDLIWEGIRKHKTAVCSSVDIQFQERRIVIKLPYLDHRNKKRRFSAGKMLAAKVYEEYEKFPTWPFWRADFILVFPYSTKAVTRDIDNYDYKVPIDILASALHTTDNAVHFSMSSNTVFTDDLEPGAYIDVTPVDPENIRLPTWKKES